MSGIGRQILDEDGKIIGFVYANREFIGAAKTEKQIKVGLKRYAKTNGIKRRCAVRLKALHVAPTAVSRVTFEPLFEFRVMSAIQRARVPSAKLESLPTWRSVESLLKGMSFQLGAEE